MDQTTTVPITSLGSSSYRMIKRLQIIIDVTVLCSALVLAYLLRFDFVLAPENVNTLLFQLILVVPIQVVAMRIYGVH